jgi:hypothetical protein
MLVPFSKKGPVNQAPQEKAEFFRKDTEANRAFTSATSWTENK